MTGGARHPRKRPPVVPPMGPLIGRIALALPLVLFVALNLGIVTRLGGRLTMPELLAAATAEETLFALRLTLATSLIALALAAMVALPGGYLLARYEFRGKMAVEAVLDLPLFMPPLVAGLGLLFLFGRRGGPGSALAEWGIDVLFSPAGVVVAQWFIATAILIPAARGAFESVDRRLVEAAATLRAGPWSAFWSVEVPLASHGLAAAALLAWARATSEFGATLMLAGATRTRTETLPMAVYLNIATGDLPVAVACGLILLAVAAASLALLRLGRAGRPRQFH